MLVGELPTSGHPGISMAGLDYPDSGRPRRSSLVRAPEPEAEHVVIEPEYYMSNYEATVTVHKSPPMARRPTFDFLEIDDETRDFPALGLHRRKVGKKNLKVTFSDHIEVDIISLVENSDDSDDEPCHDFPSDLLEPWNDTQQESQTLRQHGSPEPSRSPGRRHVQRPIVQPGRKLDGNTDMSPGRSQQLSASVEFRNAAKSVTPPQNQPMLQRRKQNQKPSLVSDVVQQKIVALKNNNTNSSPPSSGGKRFSRSVFPDIVSSLRSDKPTVSGVKRVDASAATARSYDRPWLTNSSNPPSYQQNMRIMKQKSASDQSSNVRRTTSLPKNFKLPESLSSTRFGKGVMESPRSVRS